MSEVDRHLSVKQSNKRMFSEDLQSGSLKNRITLGVYSYKLTSLSLFFSLICPLGSRPPCHTLICIALVVCHSATCHQAGCVQVFSLLAIRYLLKVPFQPKVILELYYVIFFLILKFKIITNTNLGHNSLADPTTSLPLISASTKKMSEHHIPRYTDLGRKKNPR